MPAILCWSAVSSADSSFDVRVRTGKDALSSPDGKNYELSIFPAVRKAMSGCVPPGSAAVSNLGNFTLVGLVSRSGTISAIEVEPHTHVSDCFAQKFRESQLPMPPIVPPTDKFPITVEMSVKP